MRFNEFNDNKIFNDFKNWVCKKLDINPAPKVIFSNDKDKVKNLRTYGTTSISNGSIWVYTGDRSIADTLRTLAHEMVHYKQFLNGTTHDMDEKTKQQIEDEANALAGRLMREYGKINVSIY